MKIFSFAFLFLACTSFSSANSIEQRLKGASSLINHYPDSAYKIATDLLSEAQADKDNFGLLQSNYILGYIHDIKNKEFGKAIIYYLEAIRYGEKSKFDGVDKKLASLHKNCGLIFERFKALALAEEYFQKGLQYSEKTDDLKQIVDIKYSLAGIHRENGEFQKAITFLEDILTLTEQGSKKYFDILNRISFTYFEIEEFDKVKYYSNKVIQEGNEKSVKLTAYSNHILGKVSMLEDNYDEAEHYLENALSIIRSNPESFSDKKAEFEVFVDLGLREEQLGNLSRVMSLFNSAEDLVLRVPQKPDYFELFKFQANIHYRMGSYEKSKHYEDLYSDKMNEYLEIQAEIQETDQRYNMDLITKRYFAEVDKQERIADILMYSKLTSAGLLTLLLLVIAYHRYQKIRLRRTIEQELIALKIVD